MQSAPPRVDEAASLSALYKLNVLDSPPEAEFDAFVQAASILCGVPISLVSLIDVDRQWFKANLGLPGLTETPRDLAFCAHAVLGDDIFEVPDATLDSRFADNPLVSGATDIRFYAGAPLRLSNGARVGTLCVIDREPHHLSDTQRDVLRQLGVAASQALEGRHALKMMRSVAAEAAKASLLLEHSADAVVSVSPEGQVIGWNPAAEQLFGYSPDEIIGKPLDILRQASERGGGGLGVETLGQGPAVTYDAERLHRNGSIVSVSVTVVPEINESGELIGATQFLRDIGARVVAERALEHERQRLTNIMLATQTGTWEWKVQTDELRLNERWAEMLGYSLADLAPASSSIWLGLAHPDDMMKSQAALAAHFSGKTSQYEAEVRMRHRDGHWVWVLARGCVLSRHPDGQPEWMFGTHQDISPRKLQQEALRKSQELLDRTGRLAGVGGWEVDLQTGGIFWSDETCRIHGVAPGYQPDLDNAIEFYSPEARAVVQAAVETAIADGTPFDIELLLTRADGRPVWVRTVGTAEFENGKAVRLLGAFQDVDQRVLEQRALAEAKRAAEAASQSKSQFLANMSHEIRTPMNAVLGMLTLLRKTDLTARQADYANKTNGAARSLLGLLNDILDFSKVEAGKMTLDPHPFRIDQLMRDLSVILSTNVGNKNVEVLFDIDPALPSPLMGDAMRLQQVLINLSGNAVKFTAQGEVVVSVAVLKRTEAAVEVEFAVRDTGIGIAPENQARIFSGFTQAEASTTRRFGGTGLGVAISQCLVGLMGSELRLESVLGQGSRFHFRLTLPLVAASLDAALPAASPATLRALVVDDNPTARDVLARMGRSLGWAVDTAESGEQALALMQAGQAAGAPYQAVFVDGPMPGLDGWGTRERIRAQGLAVGAPVIVMVTAHGREATAQRDAAEPSLLDGLLTKPITASMLFDAVADAQAGPSSAHGLRSPPMGQQRLSGLQLLLVEDNLNNQQVARELLEDEGASVQIANNGQEAVDAVAAADPVFDVVLMDLQMPVMDGFTATRLIRVELKMPDLPIVAMTANVMTTDRDACLAAGMNDHVGKPFELDQLVGVLCAQAAGKTRSPASLNAAPASPLADPLAMAALAAPAAGVDLKTALARLGGKTATYHRLLGGFVRDLPEMKAQLRAASAHRAGSGQIVPADEAAAGRLLHTLKGLAATLGATALAAAVGQSEQPLMSDHTPEATASAIEHACAAIDVATPSLTHLLRVLHEALQPSVTAASAGPAAGSADLTRDALPAALRAMTALLGNSDMAAMEAMAALKHEFGAVPGIDLQPLDDAITALDFERALSLCAGLTEAQPTR